MSPSSGAKLPLLTTGSYTVQQLLNYIQTNNSQANFFVRLPSPSTDQQSVGENATLQALINSNLNTTVTVQPDTALIGWLAANGQLTSSTQTQYQQIMLCFNLSGTTFYLVKPYPGTTFRSAMVTRNPAADIISNFNFAATTTLN